MLTFLTRENVLAWVNVRVRIRRYHVNDFTEESIRRIRSLNRLLYANDDHAECVRSEDRSNKIECRRACAYFSMQTCPLNALL